LTSIAIPNTARPPPAHQFIDPFFMALGWDVNNSQGFAEQYKEVIHEDKVKVGDATNALMREHSRHHVG
jgi:predicted type IV restriction endonuclease